MRTRGMRSNYVLDCFVGFVIGLMFGGLPFWQFLAVVLPLLLAWNLFHYQLLLPWLRR